MRLIFVGMRRPDRECCLFASLVVHVLVGTGVSTLDGFVAHKRQTGLRQC